MTVTRLSSDGILVVTPAATIRREMSWLNRHIPDHTQCVAVDMTVSEAVIAVMGPQARSVLQPVIDQSLENHSFGFGQAKQITMGHINARAHRVSMSVNWAGDLCLLRNGRTCL